MRILSIWLCILAISAVVGGFLWPYSINEWMVFLGYEPKMTFLGGFLLGCIPRFGQLSFPVALITWIAMMFIV